MKSSQSSISKALYGAKFLMVACAPAFFAGGTLALPVDSPVYQCGSGVGAGSTGTSQHDNAAGYDEKIFKRDLTNSYTLFESGPVRPLALSVDASLAQDNQYLFVANTPANCLEIYDVSGITDASPSTPATMRLVSAVAVGVDPVSVAVRNDKEVWVVNHVSDSVSIVKWDTNVAPHVSETLLVGDEPRDIVFADTSSDIDGINARDHVFITTAARGQHDDSFDSLDLLGEQHDGDGVSGLARVWVYDAAAPTASAPAKISLFTTAPRALAVSQDGHTVYAAGFLSGNTSTLSGQSADELAKQGVTETEDGLPLAPGNGARIVKKDENGLYRDETMLNERQDDDSEIDWTPFVANLPDRDVFRIDASNLSAAPISVSGVGTELFNMVVSGSDVFVSNMEARNHVRFVGDGAASQLPEDKLRGHFMEHRITVVHDAGTSMTARAADLNDHIDYADDDATQITAARPYSIAQPVDMVIDGTNLYVAAFGSRRVGVFSLANINAEAANSSAVSLNASSRSNFINLADDSDGRQGVGGGGPAGLVMGNGKLFVYTRFDNRLAVFDTAGGNAEVSTARTHMYTPESELVIKGRPFLYDATISSSNGTGACGSCHLYGDFDQLAWDLSGLAGPFHSTGNLPMSEKNDLGGSITNLDDAFDTENFAPDTWTMGNGYFPSVVGAAVNQPITVKEGMQGTLKADAANSDIYSEASYVMDRVNEGKDDNSGYTAANSDQVYLINEASQLWFEQNVFRALPVEPAVLASLASGSNWETKVANGDLICLDGSAPVSGQCVKYSYKCVADAGGIAAGKPDMEPFIADLGGLQCVEGRTLDVANKVAVGTYPAYKARWCKGAVSCALDSATVKIQAGPNPDVVLFNCCGSAKLMEFVGGTQLVRFSNYTTAKGIMTTQTLRGIADSGALHWRGDKTGCRNAAGGVECNEVVDGKAQEERSFVEFNEAFVNLLGHVNVSTTGGTEGLTETQMNSFRDFIMQITMPPNPVRKLDNTLTDHQQMGKNLFMGMDQFPGGTELFAPLLNNHASNGAPHLGASCNSCHLLDEERNLFGTDKSLLNIGLPVKVPQLRSMYQKVGFSDGNNDLGDSLAGFGYLHDGNFNSLAFFAGAFPKKSAMTAEDNQVGSLAVGDFLMAFPSNVKPVVGQQLTVLPSDFTGDVLDVEKRAQFTTMVRQAAAGSCDLTVRTFDRLNSKTYVADKGRASAACAINSSTNTPLSDSDGDDLCMVSTNSSDDLYFTDEILLLAVQVQYGFFANGVTLTCGAPGSIGQQTFYKNFAGAIPAPVNAMAGSAQSSVSGDANKVFDGANSGSYDPLEAWQANIEPTSSAPAWLEWDFGDANRRALSNMTVMATENGAFLRDVEVWAYNTADSNKDDTTMPAGAQLVAKLTLPARNTLPWGPQVDFDLRMAGEYRFYKLVILSADSGCDFGGPGICNQKPIVSEVAFIERNNDFDADGIANADDSFIANAEASVDTDGDGHPDAWNAGHSGSGSGLSLDAFVDDAAEWADSDSDGVGDVADNCSVAANAGQVDLDGDGEGDVCDADRDGDAIANATDPRPDASDEGLDISTAGGNVPFSAGTDQGFTLSSIGGVDSVANAVVRQSTGKLVAAGYAWMSDSYDVALARYNADGSLDTTFGSGGVVTTDISFVENGQGGDAAAFAALVQSDDKLVVAGQLCDWYDVALNYCVDTNNLIMRYNVNGSLDTTFGTGGYVSLDTQAGSWVESLYAVTQQADGKLVVAGESCTWWDGAACLDYDLLMVRFNIDGSQDTAFGTRGDGVVIRDFDNSGGTLDDVSDDAAYAILQQADGKLVVAGTNCGHQVQAGQSCEDTNTLVARYNNDGALDTGFGGGAGYVSMDSSPNSWREALFAIVQQADGKLVAAGQSCAVTGNNHMCVDYDVLLIRMNVDGSTDSSFVGTGHVNTGMVLTRDGDGDDVARSLRVQTNGKLVIAGYSLNAVNQDAEVFMARYNTNGSLDTTFSGDGKLESPLSAANDAAWGMLIQPDGKLVVAGESGNAFVTARYILDTTDTDGDGVADGQDAFVNDPAEWIDSDVDGVGNNADADDDNDGVADGLDAFSLDATESVDTDGDRIGNNADLDDDGDGYNDIVDAFPLNAAEWQDFDGDGVGNNADANDDDGGSMVDCYPDAVDPAPLNDGTTKAGDLDCTFDGDSYSANGKVTTAVGTGLDRVNASVVQADGKLVVAGYYNNGSNNDFAVVRYNANGTLDTGFGSAGKVVVAFDPSGSTGTKDDQATAVIQLADGKLAVVGFSNQSLNTTANYDMAAVRLNANGALDTAFGTSGKLTVPFVTTGTGTKEDKAFAVVEQADGKLVMAGFSNQSTTATANNDMAFARLTTAGQLDTTFDADGKLNVGFLTSGSGTKDDQAMALIRQTDDKLVAAGFSNQSTTTTANNDMALVRLTSAGAVDTAFGNSGKVTIPFLASGSGTKEDRAQAILQQADGKLVVAGYSNQSATTTANYDMALARLTATGALDTAFGSGGKVTTPFMTTGSGTKDDRAFGIVQQADGKLAAAGYSNQSSTATVNLDVAVVRYDSSGALDSGFGLAGTGKVTTSIGSAADVGFSLAKQSDGKLIVGGYSAVGTTDDFAILRYFDATAN